MSRRRMMMGRQEKYSDVINLYDYKDKTVYRYYLDSNGNIINAIATKSWYIDEFFKVKPDTTYIGNGFFDNIRVCFYDANKNFISMFLGRTTCVFTTPTNTKYIRVSGDCKDYGKKDYPNESTVIKENK